MKKTFRKILAMSLAVIMLFSVMPVAFAKDVTPVIVVSGMASYTLDDGETGEQVYGPKTEVILDVVKRAIVPATKFLVTKDWQALADAVVGDVYESIFEKMSCDEEGNSKYNITTKLFPESVDNYPEHWKLDEGQASEGAVVASMKKAVGAENTYFFNYDWRLDPYETAEKLNAYIEKVKSDKKCSKVTLVPCSMGGVMTNTYLSEYGSASIEKIVYAMSAFHGMDMVGELLNRNLNLNTDLLTEYLFALQRDKVDMQILMALLETVTEMVPQIGQSLDAFIDESLTQLSDRVYNEILVKSLGSCPGFWAFVPDEYYEGAKKAMFGDNINSVFEEKIDKYHYNVLVNAPEIMEKARQSGTSIVLLAAYGFMGPPCTKTAYKQSDSLIETYHEAGGATTALWGKTLGDENYEALGTVCSDKSHNHVSDDLIIDASTGLYPDYTWFFKYNSHVGLWYETDFTPFLGWLVETEGQPTVFDNEKYPQFMRYNRETGKLSSLTTGNRKASVIDEESNIVVRFFAIIESLYYVIMNWIDGLKK